MPDFNRVMGYEPSLTRPANFPRTLCFCLLPYFTSLAILSASSHGTALEDFGGGFNAHFVALARRLPGKF